MQPTVPRTVTPSIMLISNALRNPFITHLTFLFMYITSYEHIPIIPMGVCYLVNYTIYLVLTQSFLRKFSI